MEFNQLEARPYSFIVAVIVPCIFLLLACGGVTSSSDDSSSGTGALVFNLVYHDAAGKLQPQAAVIDCAGQGIATVEAKVYDPNNSQLADGGPWECDAGHGTITSVPAGSGRTVVILGKGADENIVFRGQKSGIEVAANSENNAGTIDCNAFVTSLLSPADGAVEAGTIGLRWNEVAGASEYRVVISQNPNLSDPAINHTTTTTSYTPSGLDYVAIYYWQVVAVDSYQNSGIGSAIWSFTTSANTAPIAKITSPVDGSSFTTADTIKFTGRGSDSEDGSLSGESLVWSSDVDHLIGVGETCVSSTLAAGTHQITLIAIDSDGLKGTAGITITVNSDPDNTSPVAQISIPEKGSTYIVGEQSQFSGSATDDEDGDLSGDSLEWRSDMYTDPICTGETCSSDKLDAGTHKITLTATDSDYATGMDAVVITVATGRLPDTGQATSFTETFGEDADYSINPPAYTKLDINGDDLSDGVEDWVMVRDDVTGLIWEVKTVDNENDIHYQVKDYQWELIQGEFIDPLNTAEFGGYDDWRLPSIKELHSLVHNVKVDLYPNPPAPAINTDYFPNTMLWAYWSSTTHAGNTGNAWRVQFQYGGVDHNVKSDTYYVRAVCGGHNNSNLLDNDDNTVTDTATGLMWQKLEVMEVGGTEVRRMNWEEALDYCESLELAGYDDWRLPNTKELQSIIDYEKSESPAIDEVFENAMSSAYWTSTTNTRNPVRAFFVNFDFGLVGYFEKPDDYYVRAVRGGK